MEGQKHLDSKKKGECTRFFWKRNGILNFRETIFIHRSNNNCRKIGKWKTCTTMRPAAGPGRSANIRLAVVGRWRILILVYPPRPLFSFRTERLLLSLIDLQFQTSPWPFPGGLCHFPQWRCYRADKIQFSVEMCFDNQVKWHWRVKKRSGHRERPCVCWG